MKETLSTTLERVWFNLKAQYQFLMVGTKPDFQDPWFWVFVGAIVVPLILFAGLVGSILKGLALLAVVGFVGLIVHRTIYGL